MFDEVNDGSILRQGASLATNDLFPGDSAQDEYRASDLVPWHEAGVYCGATNRRVLKVLRTGNDCAEFVSP